MTTHRQGHASGGVCIRTQATPPGCPQRVRSMTLATEADTRAARYREIAYELWRLAIDQRRDLSFETRRELTTIAEDLEQLAARVETD
jgi:hypothetical protein